MINQYFLRVICCLSLARSWPSTAARTIIIISRIKSKTARIISLVLFKNNPGNAWNAASFLEGFTFGSPSTSSCLRGIWQSAITRLWEKLVIEYRLLDNYAMILKSDSRYFKFMTCCRTCSKQLPSIFMSRQLCYWNVEHLQISTKSRLKSGSDQLLAKNIQSFVAFSNSSVYNINKSKLSICLNSIQLSNQMIDRVTE